MGWILCGVLEPIPSLEGAQIKTFYKGAENLEEEQPSISSSLYSAPTSFGPFAMLEYYNAVCTYCSNTYRIRITDFHGRNCSF